MCPEKRMILTCICAHPTMSTYIKKNLVNTLTDLQHNQYLIQQTFSQSIHMTRKNDSKGQTVNADIWQQ